MANDGQRVPAQIYPPQIGLSSHDTRYDDHSNLRSSETLPAHPQHVQPFSNMGDPTLTLEGDGFPPSSADQTLHGAVGTGSQVSGLALQQQSSRLAHHSFQQYPVQQSIPPYGYQHDAVQPNTGLIPHRANDSPTTASTIPPLSTPMPLFLPATPHRNSYHSSGTDGREQSRVPPNEPVNSDEARLQHGQRMFPTNEYPSDAPRTIASVPSDVIDSTRNQDISGSPGPDAYHVAPGSVLTSSSLTSLSHPVESPMVLAPTSHAPHFQENPSSAVSPALQRPVTAPSAQAGGRAGDHGGMVFGGATAGVMHEQPLSEEKPHGIVVPTGRPTYGFRSGLRSAPLTPKDQSAVTDMNSGQQTRPSSSQQRHVAYPEESYAALHRLMLPTSSVDVETLSPPSSMESRVQANQSTASPGWVSRKLQEVFAGNVVSPPTIPNAYILVIIHLFSILSTDADTILSFLPFLESFLYRRARRVLLVIIPIHGRFLTKLGLGPHLTHINPTLDPLPTQASPRVVVSPIGDETALV
ncbi:hypothetical protein CPB86DRAFT_812419 [Serendipita vermifera]|nr:hypothetical protein CPB86DRAFT_812419 [Serendipita vermifera]